MTANELQRIASRLSNQTWCRHWLNFFCKTAPVVMAIQCRDENGNPEAVPELERIGFERHSDGEFIYTITRTNEDNSPYQSTLF